MGLHPDSRNRKPTSRRNCQLGIGTIEPKLKNCSVTSNKPKAKLYYNIYIYIIETYIYIIETYRNISLVLGGELASNRKWLSSVSGHGPYKNAHVFFSQGS